MGAAMAEPPDSEPVIFPTLHVASAMTGVALCEGLSYSRMQEISDALLGYPIWTHEMAHAKTKEAITAAGAALFPMMPTREEAHADFHAAAAKALAAYGHTVGWLKVARERPVGPLTTALEVFGVGNG